MAASQATLLLTADELELLTEAMELADLTGDLDATGEQIGAMHDRLVMTSCLFEPQMID